MAITDYIITGIIVLLAIYSTYSKIQNKEDKKENKFDKTTWE